MCTRQRLTGERDGDHYLSVALRSCLIYTAPLHSVLHYLALPGGGGG